MVASVSRYSIISALPPTGPWPGMTIVLSVTLATFASARSKVRSISSLALDERQQVGVDHVGMRRRHAMRVVLIRLQRAVLEELG